LGSRCNGETQSIGSAEILITTGNLKSSEDDTSNALSTEMKRQRIYALGMVFYELFSQGKKPCCLYELFSWGQKPCSDEKKSAEFSSNEEEPPDITTMIDETKKAEEFNEQLTSFLESLDKRQAACV
jgi:hypothetical protein